MFGSTFFPGGGGGGGGGGSGIITFTPSFVNLTIGNGVAIGLYTIEGKVLKGNVSITFGTTTTMAFNPLLVAPVAFHPSLITYTTIGAVGLIDAGISLYMGEAIINLPNYISMRVISASGAYAVWTYVSNLVPFTWANGDIMTIEFSYLVS